MSLNLNLSNPGKCKACGIKNHSTFLVQTPSWLTRDARPELNNREYTFKVYSEFVRTRLDKGDADTHLATVKAFLDTHPKARFYAA